MILFRFYIMALSIADGEIYSSIVESKHSSVSG